MYPYDMRTTVTLEADVAAAVENVRREKGVGLSEAVNTLIRSGIASPTPRRQWTPRTADLGMKIDVSNIAEVLEMVESDP